MKKVLGIGLVVIVWAVGIGIGLKRWIDAPPASGPQPDRITGTGGGGSADGGQETWSTRVGEIIFVPTGAAGTRVGVPLDTAAACILESEDELKAIGVDSEGVEAEVYALSDGARRSDACPLGFRFGLSKERWNGWGDEGIRERLDEALRKRAETAMAPPPVPVFEVPKPDPDGIYVGERLTVRGHETVIVANPDGASSLFHRSVDFGRECQIGEPNEIEVKALDGDDILFLYPDGDDNTYSECPDGTLFKKSRKWYLEESKAKREAEKEKARLRRLIEYGR